MAQLSEKSGETDFEPTHAAIEDPASEGEETPRYGSLAWLELQEHVTVLGRELPAVHRVPPGSSFLTDSERGTRCALVKPDGTACRAPGTKRYGLCIVHSGGGSDPAAMSAKGTAALARIKLRRETLGIGPRGGGNPRALARMAAAERAEDLAGALLAPLDDRKLSSLERQGAARVILGETFPLQAGTVELELPADPASMGAMGWAEMQALAARLLAPDLDRT